MHKRKGREPGNKARSDVVHVWHVVATFEVAHIILYYTPDMLLYTPTPYFCTGVRYTRIVTSTYIEMSKWRV